MIKFEKITAYKDVEFDLPQRKTQKSAGYDFVAVEDIIVPSVFLQDLTLMTGRLANEEFMNKLEDSELAQFVVNLKRDPSVYDEDDIRMAADQYGPQLVTLLGEYFTINLQDMKELVSKNNLKLTLIPTGVKAYMNDDQFLMLSIRSSTPLNNYLMLANGPGIVDADYADNQSNEGHIYFQVINLSPFNIKINKGDIIGQGIFMNYGMVDDDISGGERIGGYGSTSK